ncbi:LLM class flavin-dependent oxidoreductase [Salinibacterium sp. ZJ454]|uniref:LLM class flavin-dependent oxidoreductase n=1 Tax=Salinibacterium sp. ZJ454 TaxID=2708339 RepID=UPI00141F3CA3|nr:LLM class flavin-dependent oxidoreductase [Salinibacterium sp. ZJ454]
MSGSIILNAFLMSVGHHEAAWRLPGVDPTRNVDVRHYQELAQIAEHARMDAVFFGDMLSLLSSDPERRPCEILDPTLLLSAMAAVTDHIGLIASGSTTYEAPYSLARRLASLDMISGGRAGWNIVTTQAAESAANFGLDDVPTLEERYARADEFIEVVTKLWRSWPPGSVVADKAQGVYARRDLVAPIDFKGQYFKVRGPLNVSRSPQGEPVRVQAGSSDAGIAQAARFAEAVFTAQRDMAAAVTFRTKVRDQAQSVGRDPDLVKVLPGVVPIVASTSAKARRLKKELDDVVMHDEGIISLASLLDVDPAELDLDGPLPTDVRDPKTVQTFRSRYALTLDFAQKERMTVREVLNSLAIGRGHWTLVGTPNQVADSLEMWFRAGAADGFNVMCPVLPQHLQVFAEQVIPILQDRNLFRREYDGSTLRDNYRLPQPAV